MEEQLKSINQRLDAICSLMEEQHKKNGDYDRRIEELVVMVKSNQRGPAVSQQSPHQQPQVDVNKSADQGNNSYSKPVSFSPKLELPKFNGINTRNWLMKCGHYFDMCKIPVDQRIHLAALHMVDKAEVWVNSYLASRRDVTWYKFVNDVNARFVDNDFGTVVEQFDKLQQVDDLGVNGNDVHLVFDEITDPLLGNQMDDLVTDVDEYEHVKSVLMQSNHNLPEDVCEIGSLQEVASESAMKPDFVEDKVSDDRILSSVVVHENKNDVMEAIDLPYAMEKDGAALIRNVASKHNDSAGVLGCQTEIQIDYGEEFRWKFEVTKFDSSHDWGDDCQVDGKGVGIDCKVSKEMDLDICIDGNQSVNEHDSTHSKVTAFASINKEPFECGENQTDGTVDGASVKHEPSTRAMVQVSRAVNLVNIDADRRTIYVELIGHIPPNVGGSFLASIDAGPSNLVLGNEAEKVDMGTGPTNKTDTRSVLDQTRFLQNSESEVARGLVSCSPEDVSSGIEIKYGILDSAVLLSKSCGGVVLFESQVSDGSTKCAWKQAISTTNSTEYEIGAINGVLIKGGDALERAQMVKYVVVDKTGTSTQGKVVTPTKVFTEMQHREFLTLVASTEASSEHPLAKAILQYAHHFHFFEKPSTTTDIINSGKEPKYSGWLHDTSEFCALPGRGIQCLINRKQVLVGNRSLLTENGDPIPTHAEKIRKCREPVEECLRDVKMDKHSVHDLVLVSVFHKGIQCDISGVHPIVGPRFKSLVKYSYDMCSICFANVGSEAEYMRMDFPMNSHGHSSFNSMQHCVGHPPTLPSDHSKLDSCFIEDVNILDGTIMTPSTHFIKIWRKKNNGTVGKDKFSGETLSSDLKILADGCPVDKEIDIAINFTAPVRHGSYISYWRMASPSGQTVLVFDPGGVPRDGSVITAAVALLGNLADALGPKLKMLFQEHSIWIEDLNQRDLMSCKEGTNIIGFKFQNVAQVQYLLQWKGRADSDSNWENAASFAMKFPALVDQYFQT